MDLNALDFVVLFTIGLSVLVAAWRGLVRTLFGLAAWALSLVSAPFLAPWVLERFSLSWGFALALSFLAVFVVTRMIGSLTAKALAKVGLSGVDRLLGAAFGAARALLIIAILAMLAHAFKLDRMLIWREARVAPFLDGIVQWIEPLLPERLGGPKQV